MERYINLIIILLITLIFAGVDLKLYLGYQEKINNLETKIKDFQDKSSLGRELLGVSEEYSHWEKQLLGGFFELKSVIEKIAEDNQVRINSLKPGSRQAQKGFSKEEILITAKATYDNLVRFIEKIEKKPALSIKYLSIKEREKDEALVVVLRILGITEEE